MDIRNLFKQFIKKALRFESKLILKRFKPRIIAVTGSVGKTSTKNAIDAVLSSRFFVRSSIKSYNSAIGIPLTIINKETAWGSWLGWLINLLHGIRIVFRAKRHGYPEVLVLEAGVDRPKDMKDIVSIIKPDIAVVTALGEIPVHIEFFSGPEAVTREKSKLISAVPATGTVILNCDDLAVLDMKEKTKAEIITFGFSEFSDVRASNYKISILDEGEGGYTRPEGINFRIDYKGGFVPIRLFNAFGKQQVYAALAATAVGLKFNMNLVEISGAIQRYEPPPGRLRLLRGIKESWILDDTYNSSPLAVHAALDVLEELPAKRKIAVLGDMLELGKYTMKAHQDIGTRAANAANVLVTVGLRAKFIAESASNLGFPKKQIVQFEDAREAGKYLQGIIEAGDLILLKGSQLIRLEKTVEEIMAEPERAEKLLCRQDEYWKNQTPGV